jgi:hypothetical protein
LELLSSRWDDQIGSSRNGAPRIVRPLVLADVAWAVGVHEGTVLLHVADVEAEARPPSEALKFLVPPTTA